ncbi:hypothetical protein M9Y10_045237 [Tritrichomonas musculus]|uniref:TPR Domain containing protein n=1 Tax=Tritrichomonas musculus TaxID=1915356 RepID=A0ABR2JUV3_9EUKA
MKSEIEQFNKLQFPPPLKSFDTIKFHLADKRPTLTYTQAVSISEQSMNYFAVGNPTPKMIRSRYFVENPVKLYESVPRRFIELSQDISNSADIGNNNNNNSQKIAEYKKLLGCYLRRGEYKNIISLVQKVHHQTHFVGILPIYAFISSIILKDDDNEFNFFQIIEKQLINNIQDIKHIYHLFDELYLLSSKEDYPTPLLDISFINVSRLKDILNFRFHIFPTIQLNTRYFRTPDRIFDLSSLLTNVSSKLPPLIPIGEGFFGIPPSDPQTILNSNLLTSSNSSNSSLSPQFNQKSSNYRPKGGSSSKNRSRTPVKSKESTEVLTLISESKWEQAVNLATEVLTKNPKDSEMYLHRAFALYHFAKMEDALNDCTTSLIIRKTDKALRMRASFWLLLGEADLCKEDLQMMDDKSLYNNLFKPNTNKAQNNSPSVNKGKTTKSPQKNGKRVNFDNSKKNFNDS